MADHGLKPGVDLPGAAFLDPIHCSPRIVVAAKPGNSAQHPECVVMGIEQYFLGLQYISGSTVTHCSPILLRSSRSASADELTNSYLREQFELNEQPDKASLDRTDWK